MAKAQKIYKLKLPSHTSNLELIREFVSRVAKNVGFGEDDIGKIELAVDEACANVIKHAYNKNEKKPIDIVIKIDYQKFTIIVTDQGKGFDPNKLKTPDMGEYLAEMRVGGLGIYLMRTLMDEVDFFSHPGKGNQVRMVKNLIDKNANSGEKQAN